MSSKKVEYRLVITEADYSDSGEMVTDSFHHAHLVLNMLRETGRHVGVFIETVETTIQVVRSDKEFVH